MFCQFTLDCSGREVCVLCGGSLIGSRVRVAWREFHTGVHYN
jgi:hypothetical protein